MNLQSLKEKLQVQTGLLGLTICLNIREPIYPSDARSLPGRWNSVFREQQTQLLGAMGIFWWNSTNSSVLFPLGQASGLGSRVAVAVSKTPWCGSSA